LIRFSIKIARSAEREEGAREETRKALGKEGPAAPRSKR